MIKQIKPKINKKQFRDKSHEQYLEEARIFYAHYDKIDNTPQIVNRVIITDTPRSGHPDFYQILEELADLHARKNQDYSGDDPLLNFKMCEHAGIPAWKGVVVRLTDKMSRILTFAKKGTLEVKDEAITDTLQDMAVYAILALILYREGKKE